MANKEDILLELGIRFPADQFKKSYEKSFKDLEKASQRASKFGQGKIGDLIDRMANGFGKGAKSIKIAEQALAKYQAQQKTVGQGLHAVNKNLAVAQKKVVDYERQLQTLSGSQREATQQAIDDTKAQIKAMGEKQSALRDLFAEAKQAQEDIQFDIEDMKFEFSGTKLLEAAEEAGKELAEPLTALLSKDIEGAGKALGKLAGRGIQTALGAVGRKVGDMGGGLKDKAAARAAGGNNGAITKAMGSLGSFMGKLGPMIQTVAKLGPMLGVAAGAIMSLVKLFIDADAVVKEFNKGMVEAGGTGQIFSKTMGSARTKVLAMTTTLDEFREAANSVRDNLDWGITAETHKEVLQNLQAEGVTLATMQNQYAGLNAKSAAFSKDQGSITQAAVAYSRQMGVSLQEVTGFQAEMMTEMGSTLAGTVDQFRIMSAGAEEAGIATNKFFAMIRGVSADLSLYNTRLEDAVKLLGKLGKVMSPRNAQKFMQTAMNAYKGMSFQDKVKSSILAGPAKTAKIVAEDIASKNQSIAEKISQAGGGTVEDIKKALEAGPAGKDSVRKAIEQAEAKGGKPLGDIREAVSRLNVEKKRAKGGLVGNAAALSQVSAVGALEHKFAAATRFGKLGEGIGGEVSGQVGGMDEEEIMQAQIMKDAIDEQREKLIKEGKDRAKVEAMTWTQIYDTMDQTQKDAADGKDLQEEANKRMGTNVQSITDKLQILIDWFTNKFYNVMIGIWDVILSIAEKFGAGDGAARKMDKLNLIATKTGNKELSEIASKATSPKDFHDALLQSKLGQAQGKALTDNPAAIAELVKKNEETGQKINETSDPGERAKLEKEFKERQAEIEQKQAQFGAVARAVEGQMGGSEGSTSMKADQVGSAASKAGFSPEVIAKLSSATAAGQSLTEASRTAGIDEAEQGRLIDQIRQLLSPQQLAAATGQAAKDPAVKAMTPEDQTKAVAEGTAKALPATEQAGKMASESGSIFTHDIHSEGILEDIYDALRQKGVRLDKSWMDNHMKKMVEEATLDALRVGLLEYYMYKDLQPQDIADALKRGVDPKALGKGLVDRAREGVLPADAIGALGGNAEGGLVTGIRGGLAQISPAPGEGLASIGRGERIVSAGGGGGSTVRVELSLKDDLGRLIEAKAQEVVVRHGAAEKNR